MEWLFLTLVLAGVWLHKTPLRAVLGPRWDSFRAFGSDLGIAVALLACSIVVTSLLGPHHAGVGTDPSVRFLMPVSVGEKWLWLLVALSAGICEEAVYRGYLQRQFTVLTRSAPAGILLSAAMFGAAHAYQGLRNALPIAAGAFLSGTVAHWRRSVRPGMIAHTLQDLLALVVAH